MRSTRLPCTRLGCWPGTSPLFTLRGHTSFFSRPYAPTKTRILKLGLRRFSGCSQSRLSTLRGIGTGSSGIEPSTQYMASRHPSTRRLVTLAERELTVLRAPELIFERIQLDSRLEITLAAAGSTRVIIYALHLLCTILRDLEGIGDWLPRLVAGWRKARRDAEMVRHEHRVEVGRGQLTDLLIKQNISRLMRLAQNPELQDLHPVQVTLVGAEDETPQDIREAWKR